MTDHEAAILASEDRMRRALYLIAEAERRLDSAKTELYLAQVERLRLTTGAQ